MWKTLCLPAVNGVVLALTTMEHIDAFLRVCQIMLVLSTIVFTLVQTKRILMRTKREKQMSNLVDEAHRECQKAQIGNCPLKNRLEKLEAEK